MIVVLVLVVIGLTGIYCYLNIDKQRFASRRILMEMRPELEKWLLSADALMKREKDAALQKEYYDLCASIGSEMEKELENNISTINKIHRALKRTASQNSEDITVKETADELSECFSHFAYARELYNSRISAVNRYIIKEPSSWVAKLLHMKVFETIDDLTIL